MVEVGRMGILRGRRSPMQGKFRLGGERKLEAFGTARPARLNSEKPKGPRFFLRKLNRLMKSDSHAALSFLAKDPAKRKQSHAKELGRPDQKQLFEKSVRSAMNTMDSVKEIVEEIKRKAALEAIRRQMQVMRQSIRADKRLSAEARQNALVRVDRYEKRILAKEALKWHKPGILKHLQHAVLSMQEMAD